MLGAVGGQVLPLARQVVDELLLGVHGELAVDAAHVRLHRVGRHGQRLAHGAPRLTLGQQQHDLALALSDLALRGHEAHDGGKVAGREAALAGADRPPSVLQVTAAAQEQRSRQHDARDEAGEQRWILDRGHADGRDGRAAGKEGARCKAAHHGPAEQRRARTAGDPRGRQAHVLHKAGAQTPQHQVEVAERAGQHGIARRRHAGRCHEREPGGHKGKRHLVHQPIEVEAQEHERGKQQRHGRRLAERAHGRAIRQPQGAGSRRGAAGRS